MGFLERTTKCGRCGKEISIKMWELPPYWCDECLENENKISSLKREKEEKLRGYLDYSAPVFDTYFKNFTLEEYDAMLAHRNAIVEKYAEKFDFEKIKQIAWDYENLTKERAAEIISTVAAHTCHYYLGALRTKKFIISTNYDGVIIDKCDIFAVAYQKVTTQVNLIGPDQECIECVFFTNDSYVPVLAMMDVADMKKHEIFKSKEGRADIEEVFTEMCPNLKYPVMEVKKLKKIIKADNAVNGNINVKDMLKYLDSASAHCSGIFNAKEFTVQIGTESKKILEQCGCLTKEQLEQILSANTKLMSQILN